MREFDSVMDCIQYVHSTLVVDLKNYISHCSHDHYKSLFKPTPKGIYLKGEVIKPLVDLTKPHYLRPVAYKDQQVPVQSLTPITEYDQAKGTKSDIVDATGKVLLTSRDIMVMERVLTDDPGYGYQAIRAASYFGLSFLSRFCAHANISPPHDYRDIFIEEAWPQVEDESLDVFNQLKYAIASFVGDDELYLYYYRMQESVLYIQKNVDYRVYEYYLKKHAEEKEETGDE